MQNKTFLAANDQQLIDPNWHTHSINLRYYIDGTVDDLLIPLTANLQPMARIV
jgi:hypothetical protein